MIVSIKLTPPSSRLMVTDLVDCPHESHYLPNREVAQSMSIAAGRSMRQSWPLNQSGEILGMLNLEVAAKRLLPHGYGEGYCMAVLDQLKAWGGGCSMYSA